MKLKIVVTDMEHHNLLNQLIDSKIGNRISAMLRTKYTANDEGEYPTEYWDEMLELHIETINQFAKHLQGRNYH